MNGRLLTALGILAAAVAIASAAALALAIVGSDDSSAGAPGETVVVDLGTKSPSPTPQADSAAAAAAPSTPVTALVERPARGPAFAIAQLRPGAHVALWSEPGGDLVETLGPRTEFGSPVVLSVVRRSGGWLGVSTPDLPNGQLGWIRHDPLRIHLYWTKYSLHADLSDLSLSLRYGKGTVGRFLVTVGAPGSETPVGRYGITDALSFDESPFYGCCALALSGRQTRLPAGWLGGDRLAIHGTPGPVGGAESHGCIRATDATMRELFRRIPLGTPVFVDE
jgi:lipoprotein-anchoring transpeptidase ErfK/SrfK